MDSFMDSITHKVSAADLIKANSQADAFELEETKKTLVLFENQMQKVDAALSSVEEAGRKSSKTADDVQRMVDSSDDRLRITSDASIEGINRAVDNSIAGINKTIDESLAKIEEIKSSSDNAKAITDGMDSISVKLEFLKDSLEEYMHADHVRIYRNVQACVKEELENQTETLKASYKKRGPILPLLIVSVVLGAANLAVIAMLILGLI